MNDPAGFLSRGETKRGWVWHGVKNWLGNLGKRQPPRRTRSSKPLKKPGVIKNNLTDRGHETERIIRFEGTKSLVITQPGSDTKLDVQSLPELHILKPKQKQKSIWHKLWPFLVSVLVIVSGAMLWALFVWPQNHPLDETIELKPAPIPLSLRVVYPRYVAIGDQGHVAVTIVNRSSQPISGTVVIVFDGCHIACTSGDRTNRIQFQDLAPRVSQDFEITFVLNEAPRFYVVGPNPPPVKFHLQVADTNGNKADAFSDQEIKLGPIPYLGKILSPIIGAVCILLINFPVDWLKRLVSID